MTNELLDELMEELLHLKEVYGYESIHETIIHLLQQYEDDLRTELEDEDISWEQFITETKTMAMVDPEYAAELQKIRIFVESWIDENDE